MPRAVRAAAAVPLSCCCCWCGGAAATGRGGGGGGSAARSGSGGADGADGGLSAGAACAAAALDGDAATFPGAASFLTWHSAVHKHYSGAATLTVQFPPNSTLPYWTYDPVQSTFGGFIPNVLDMLGHELGLGVVMTTTVAAAGSSAGAFSAQLVKDVSDNAPMSVAASEVTDGECAPFVRVFSERYTGVVQRSVASQGMWRLFAPFTVPLWGAFISAIVLTALLIVLLNALAKPAEDEDEGIAERMRPAFVAKALYHSLTAMLSGEDYEWVTWPGRILRVALLFVVLITTATYTANLAAFFTAPRVVLRGPGDNGQLQDAAACVRNRVDARYLQPHAQAFVYPAAPDALADALEWCVCRLGGSASVVLAPAAAANLLSLRDCGTRALVPAISVAEHTIYLRLIAPAVADGERNVTHLASRLTVALDWLKFRPEYNDLEANVLGIGKMCPVAAGSDTDKITLESQAGLFIIAGSIAGVSVALSTGAALRRRLRPPTEEAVTPKPVLATEGEMLARLMGDVQHIRRALGVGDRRGTVGDASSALRSGLHAEEWGTEPTHPDRAATHASAAARAARVGFAPAGRGGGEEPAAAGAAGENFDAPYPAAKYNT